MGGKRIEDDKRLFKRLIISEGDLDHAGRFADFILEQNLHACTDDESRYLHRGLNLALIVAYCRPFSGNKGSADAASDLPGRYLSEFSEEERTFHSHMLDLRNRDHAHSDPDAHTVQVSVDDWGGEPVASALGRNAYVPLTRQETERLRSMITKLTAHILEEHFRIQGLLNVGDDF